MATMSQSRRGAGGLAMFTFVVLLCTAPPAHGQLGNVITQLFGGGAATTATPAATTTATPAATTTATPSATPVATTKAATSVAASTTATPAATSKATVASSATTTASAAAAAPSTALAAAPDTVVAAAAPQGVEALASTAKASPPPPAPPAIVVNPSKLVSALPADEIQPLNNTAAPSPTGSSSDSALTAADMVVQISGNGVTPFDIPQQTILLRAAGSVLTTVSLSALRIRYVTSAASISGRRLLSETPLKKGHRALLDTSPSSPAAIAAQNGNLYNVATVTLEANCSNANDVGNTIADMQNIINNNLLSSALQSYGATTWGVDLLSITASDPNTAIKSASTCRKKMGVFCLDGTSLSVAGAETIIGIGCFVILAILVFPCVCLEWRRRSGRMAELEPTPATPKSPMDKVQKIYNNFISTVKQASPLHRGPSSGRTAFSPDTPTGIDTPDSVQAQKHQAGINVNASAR